MGGKLNKTENKYVKGCYEHTQTDAAISVCSAGWKELVFLASFILSGSVLSLEWIERNFYKKTVGLSVQQTLI